MDAIILAAGLGTRLRPHTLTTPKPLLPLQDRPILDWLLASLPPAVNRILVVVHYLADHITTYLQSQTHAPQWQTVVQHEPRGTGDALRACREHLRSDRFMVMNGDDLIGSADLAALASCDAGVLVHTVDEPRRFGIAMLKPDGTLERLVEKPDLDGPQLANTGAYVFPRTIFQTELQVSARGEYEATDYVSALARTQSVQVIRAGFWYPIGNVEAWELAQSMDLVKEMAS